MNTNKFQVNITNNYFESVSRQKLAAHEALGELIDNAVSNPRERKQALVLLSVD